MLSREDFYLKIKSQLTRQLPVVAWRKAGSATVSMLFQEDDTVHCLENYGESGFVFAGFEDKAPAVFIPGARHICCMDEAYEGVVLDPDRAGVQGLNAGREAHIKLVSRGIEAIEAGRFKKVVLSRKAEISLVNPDPVVFFRRLLAGYPEAFCYLWFHPVTGLWLGATPETLLRVDGEHFETMALAGTQKYKGAATVSWGRKEREEQQLVSDFIVERLRPLSAQLQVSEPYTARAGGLLHLRTDIKGVIQHSEFSILNLIKALHPTPAVCGYPGEAAKQFILEHENYSRDFYTGFLGELNFSAKNDKNPTQQSSVYVNLRCMQLRDHSAILYVGGGINKGSIPEKEWQETVDKAQTMLGVLNHGC